MNTLHFRTLHQARLKKLKKKKKNINEIELYAWHFWIIHSLIFQIDIDRYIHTEIIWQFQTVTVYTCKLVYLHFDFNNWKHAGIIKCNILCRQVTFQNPIQIFHLPSPPLKKGDKNNGRYIKGPQWLKFVVQSCSAIS